MTSFYYYKSLSLLCLISLAQSYNNGGVTVDLIHRDSPLSPYHDPSQTRFERLRDAFDRSTARKSSLFSTLLSKSKSIDAVVEAPLNGATGEYLIEYQIGTPPVRQLSIIDTSSDLTWVQCKPCARCYKQDYPLFDPTATKSYRTVSCHESICSYGDTTGGDCGDNNSCQYYSSYKDGSYSKGDLSSDTLTLGPNTSLPNFFFGCGRNNTGPSSIFGLGTGVLSIVAQQAETVQGRFSYCLSPLDSNASSKISFGADAVVAGDSVLSTPLVSNDPDALFFYSLNLEGLSAGKQRFDNHYKPPTQLSTGGNIIIDSGTTLTFVSPELYQGIETALVKAINATRVTDPQGKFSLCYQSDTNFTSPPITAHFQGADIVLPEGSTFVQVEKGVVCFTLLPSRDVAVFGSLHQVGYHIGYDLNSKKLSFLKTDCAKPR